MGKKVPLIPNKLCQQNPSQAQIKIQTENKALKSALEKQFKTPLTKEKITEFLLKEGYFKSRVTKTPEGFTISYPVKLIFILKGNHFLSDYSIKKLSKPIKSTWETVLKKPF